jgi:hypothetical protein
MRSYETVVDALTDLKKRGYTLNFNIAFDKLMCSGDRFFLNPDEFEITEVYRFEGNSNPDDEDIVFAVESKSGPAKGVITSAFGLYADSVSSEMIKKLSVHPST